MVAVGAGGRDVGVHVCVRFLGKVVCRLAGSRGDVNPPALPCVKDAEVMCFYTTINIVLILKRGLIEMIITVGNTKGGVGKTTVAVQLAIARALAGRDVWLVDADRQGTAQTAISVRAEAGQQPGIACSTYPDGPTLRSQVQQQAGKYDDVVIDAGGRDSTALRAALVLSDLLVIPFQPRSFDVWALSDIAALVEEARSVRDGLRAVAILNAADPGEHSTDNAEAAAAVAEVPGLEYLPTPLRRRKAYSNAAGAGLSVLELKPRDPKAVAEIEALVNALF